MAADRTQLATPLAQRELAPLPSLLLRPAAWLAAPVIVLSYLLLTSTPVEPGYGLSKAAAANGTMVVIGPYVAVCAAYETSLLRAYWGRWAVTRPWWMVLGARLLPVASWGFAVIGAVYLLSLGRGSFDLPGWQLPLLAGVGIVAWSSFGAALALVFGRLVTLSSALLLPFLILALPPAWEPVWLRHLNGTMIDCCSSSQVLDARAVTASLGFLGGILVLSVCVARVRLAPPQHRPWLAAVVSLLALASAAVLVSQARDMTATPGAPRPASDLVCQGEVCIWPEDREALARNEAAWARVQAAWREMGLPATAQPIGPIPAEGLLPVVSRAATEPEVIESMALTLPRAMLGCHDDYTDEPRNQQLDRLSYLLLVGVGADQPDAFVMIDQPPEPADAEAIWHRLEPCG